MVEISRAAYAALYGPTVGDQVRLGDTDLWIEVEQDLTVGGEEVVFGGGKSIRESMGARYDDPRGGCAGHRHHERAGARLVGHRPRRRRASATAVIVALGRAGNPDIADGVHPDLRIGPSTDVIAGEGRILTAGAIDSHVHLLSPSQLHEALATGITTIVGGGTGPSEGSKATTVTPGAWHLERMHRASTRSRSTCCCSARGTRSAPRRSPSRRWPVRPGTRCTRTGVRRPAAIDAALRAADEWGLQVALHADSLNEAGFVESTLRAIAGRGDPRVPRRGRRRRACAGHPVDRVVPACHPGIDEPDAAAHRQHRRRAPRHAHGLPPPQPGRARGPRVRRVADPGHDDRGRGHPARPRRDVGHLVRRAGDGPDRRGDHPDLAGRARDEGASGLARTSLPADNERARRYVAKYTINPAIAHGIDHVVGSVEAGQAGRPDAVGPAVLRGPAGAGDQGWRDRLGRAG